MPLSFAPEESTLDLHMEMPASDWNLFTDVAVQVLDTDGEAVLSDGFGYRKLHLHLERPKDGKEKLTLEIIAATADPADNSPDWHLSIDEIRRLATTVPVTVEPVQGDGLILYPDHDAALQLQLGATPPAPPTGASWLIRLRFEPEKQDLPPFELDLAARPR